MKKNIKIIVAVVVLLIICLSVFLVNTLTKKKESTEFKSKFSSRNEKYSTFNANGYTTLGWLQVEGTNIDIPILDSSAADQEIEYSFAWLSPLYQKGGNRKVIIGHNVLNVSNKPMYPNKELRDFEELLAFTYYDFAQKNLFVQFNDWEDTDSVYVIYAIGFYTYGIDDSRSYMDNTLLDKYIKGVKDNSLYKYDIDVNKNDTLLTLKTCTRYFGLANNQVLQIDLRKVRKNESVDKVKVTKTKIYKELIENEEKM